MSGHLLLVTIGPVQEFIAQARRTRDLWFGSHMLSELSRAAARKISETGGELIFPAFEKGHEELEPCWEMIRPGTGKPPLAVANKILAHIPEGANPADLAKEVENAVRGHWKTFAEKVKAENRSVLADGIDALWDEQIETFLEFYAAWVEMGEDYAAARKAVEEAVSARKNLRGFAQWRRHRHGAPKSSLDGGRYSVLAEDRTSGRFARYRIGDGEQLDAVGLVKRTGGKPEQFVPVTNVALASWVLNASEVAGSEMKNLASAVENEKLGSRIAREGLRYVEAFSRDAGVFFLPRLVNMFKENGLPQKEAERKAKGFWKEHVRPVLGKMSEPYPYVACLVADGDRMGETLDGMKESKEQKTFSEKLGEFARAVRSIVESRHNGLLVYAGGDDVLAFLPLPEAVACAEALKREFAARMEGTAAGRVPTLSVGLGIGHIHEAMGELLELGREAEKLAKGGDDVESSLRRNALAVVLDKRSGGKVAWRARWEDGPKERLEEDVALLGGRLSRKKVYEMRRLVDFLPLDGGDEWKCVLDGEVRRILKRSHLDTDSKGITPEEAGLDLEGDYPTIRRKLAEWTDRLLIAHAFETAAPKTKEKHSGRNGR